MTTPAVVMRKYMGLLNEISALGMQGFGRVLDTASPADLLALDQAAETVRKQIERANKR